MAEHPGRVREQLEALPEIPLPDVLWERVAVRRAQKIRRRKWSMAGATMALVAVMVVPMLRPALTGVEVEKAGPTVVLQATPALPDVQAEVRALDRALQVAYDRGASDAEIAPMWVARDALLAGARTGTPLSRPGI